MSESVPSADPVAPSESSEATLDASATPVANVDTADTTVSADRAAVGSNEGAPSSSEAAQPVAGDVAPETDGNAPAPKRRNYRRITSFLVADTLNKLAAEVGAVVSSCRRCAFCGNSAIAQFSSFPDS